jgi:DNA repair protein SbcD/Mre11
MTEPIRVLHFADVHIGMENYGKTDPKTGLSSRVVDFVRRLDDMVDYAREQAVDLVIFAGDAFKTRSPNPTYQREFAWRVRDLAQLAPVVLLVGNHDLPPNALRASSVEIYDTLAVDNVWVAQDYDVNLIETARGKVIVGAAPYPVRARLMHHAERPTNSIKEADALLEETLSDILDDLARRADALAGNTAIPRLLTGHFTVNGAVVGSERQVMLGRDVKIPLSLIADDRWDYVALGHIHKHQNLTSGRDDVPPVVYSGSLERIDFGEQAEDKGFCWVELAREATTWGFVPVAARAMVTLRADCREDTNPTRTVLDLIAGHHLQGAIVRLIIDLTPETNALLQDEPLRDALKQADVFHIAAIQRRVHRSDRARLDHNPEEMDHEQLLAQYLKTRAIAPARREQLLTAAKAIFNPSEADEA